MDLFRRAVGRAQHLVPSLFLHVGRVRPPGGALGRANPRLSRPGGPLPQPRQPPARRGDRSNPVCQRTKQQLRAGILSARHVHSSGAREESSKPPRIGLTGQPMRHGQSCQMKRGMVAGRPTSRGVAPARYRGAEEGSATGGPRRARPGDQSDSIVNRATAWPARSKRRLTTAPGKRRNGGWDAIPPRPEPVEGSGADPTLASWATY